MIEAFPDYWAERETITCMLLDGCTLRVVGPETQYDHRYMFSTTEEAADWGKKLRNTLRICDL